MPSKMSEYRQRKLKIFNFLGGVCVECGSKRQLQVDHKDHLKKNFTILDRWAYAWATLVEELKLCQLLCKKCHLKKSIEEGSLAKGWTSQPQPIKHGTVWAYNKYKCRCKKCKQAKKLYEKSRTCA